MPHAIGPAASTVPTAASVLTVVQALERYPLGSPARTAFLAVLFRKGNEAMLAGGAPALVALRDAVAADDPGRAGDRVTLIESAWTDLFNPQPTRSAR